MAIENEKGGISVETQHIFPIIKKWLYSDKEIFLREIVSNSCDAITKLRRLISLGQAKDIDEKFRIDVYIDEAAKTLIVSDNGIGMTEEELKKYICSIALSGALDFIQKYEGKDAKDVPGIIGHFGLGFYSCFMVSDNVEIVTKSYDGSDAVKWVCTSEGDYEIMPGTRSHNGTDVIMHINEENAEYLTEARIRDVLEKYCAFMPEEIYFKTSSHVCEPGTEGNPTPAEAPKEGEAKPEEPKEPKICSCKKPINDIHPLWTKNPSECKDEDYRAFYTKVFHDWREPLFWVHINADYPLNFKGIIYFPRLNAETDNLEGQIKLYYNQVFVADNIKEVIPEYLLMLKGVLDCPELPLNVSRSYLQNNGYVAKISAHITKKVTDKLNSLFTSDRKHYEELWPDMKLFIEYGCLRDQKFYDRVKPSLLLPLTDGTYETVDEYLDGAKDQHKDIVYYTSDKTAHAAYIAMYNARGIKVVLLDKFIDQQFINAIETDRKIKFLRVDAEVAGALKGDGEVYDNAALTALFKKVAKNDKLEVKYEALKDVKVPAIINISEQTRRIDDMMKVYRAHGQDVGGYSVPLDTTLVVNSSSPLVRRLGETLDETAARQVYTLALLSQRQLTSDELVAFLNDSFDIINRGMENEPAAKPADVSSAPAASSGASDASDASATSAPSGTEADGQKSK